MACQENIWLLFEEAGLGHLMVQAAGRLVEVLVRKKVDRDATSHVIDFSNLERGDGEVSVEACHLNKACIAVVYLHATVCGVEHFISKPLDGFRSPGSNTGGEVCQAALHRLNPG